MLAAPALADPSSQPGREIWAGADVSSDVWLLYSGVTYAPWSGVHEQGFRFRAASGYGEYEYDRDPHRVPDPRNPRPTHLEARTYFADFLVGYLVRYGDLTAKAFVGASVISHDISPKDEETVAIGDEIGFKGVLELWLNHGPNAWSSLDLSWSTAHETKTGRLRTGYRVFPQLSLGVEGALNLDAQGECRIKGVGAAGCRLPGDIESPSADLLDYARAGLFVRYEWLGSEASLSAGVLGHALAAEEPEFAPYVTVNWLAQF